MTTQGPQETTRSIVFFDGYCHLCNGFVDWMISRDSNRRLFFAPIQGQTAQKFLSETQRADLDRIYFFHENQLFEKSTAVLKAVSLLPNWTWVPLILWTPRPLRDFVYDLVARFRYQLFGKSETCRIALPEEKSQLLP